MYPSLPPEGIKKQSRLAQPSSRAPLNQKPLPFVLHIIRERPYSLGVFRATAEAQGAAGVAGIVVAVDRIAMRRIWLRWRLVIWTTARDSGRHSAS